MKKIALIIVMLSISFAFAQHPEKKVTYVKTGNLIEATYYYTNGAVEQQGFFKNGKRCGNWVSYNESGEKIAIGYYENGMKTGKWIFKKGNTLNEVDYLNNKIVKAEQWSHKTKMAIRDK